MSRSRRLSRRRQAGFSSLETIAASGILILGLGAFLQASTLSHAALVQQRETALALAAARGRIEAMRSVPFGEVFARFNADPLDDPAGAATAAGGGFAADGLGPVAGDEDGEPGQVVFGTGGPGGNELREDLDLPGLGLPRDLNLDGAIDAMDHAGDYEVLPVRVEVVWRSHRGPRRVSLATLLGEG